MQYFAKSNEKGSLSNEELKDGIFSSLEKLGLRKKVLAIPPDITRFYSYSGIITKFIYQFYNAASNTNLAKMKYDFILIQNGKEVYRDTGLTQIGGDYRNFAFDNSGPIIIRFEGITNTAGTVGEKSISGISTKAARTTEFSTIVYDNPEKTTHEQIHTKPAQRLEFYYELLLAIILAPAALFIVAIFWMKRKPKNSEPKYGSVNI